MERAVALDESGLGRDALAICWYWLVRAVAPLAIAVILLQSASAL